MVNELENVKAGTWWEIKQMTLKYEESRQNINKQTNRINPTRLIF